METIETLEILKGFMALRDYQTDIIERLREAWRTHRSVMVQMPTGTGKTHVMVNSSLTPGPSPRGEGRIMPVCSDGQGMRCDIQQSVSNSDRQSLYGNDGRSGNDGQIWIIAHRRELVAQIEETLARYGIKTDDGLEDNGKGRIKVMSIQWLSRHWEDVRRAPELIVIDEAHHAVAETYKEMWNRWPKARFLGLTATPCRMNRRGFTDLFDTLICSWSVAEFIEKGYLSAFDYVSIRQGSEEQRLIDSLEKRGADGDYQIKEMNDRLNRQQSIGRLYESKERFAKDKKGIVYAISIDHARSIAAYYNKKGVTAVPIDSRTPATERKRMVEDFKAGRIQVLVNVDIFSEGFDCPDVEFVQMARPTLSLAKYLQQVGRGLRKVKGKEACVLIDNVGLYRVFGLPTVAWDWPAMFQGRMQGKAINTACMRSRAGMTAIHEDSKTTQEDVMEVIVSHEQLLADIGRLKDVRPVQADGDELKAWRDEGSGLWGLRRGRMRTTESIYINVLDIKYDMAAVRFKNKACGIVSDAGETIWTKDGCRSVKFLKNGLCHVVVYGRDYYVDIYSWRTYVQRPKVRKYGSVELLEIDNVYFSRTKTVYVNDQRVGKHFIHWRKFYLTIYDEKVPFPGYHKENMSSGTYTGHACILEGDNDNYYWLYYWLADGSIVITDNARRYYYAAEGRPKKYIGCRGTEEEWSRCKAEIERMARQAERNLRVSESERAEKRRQLLVRSDGAVPFRAGMRWGLKVGNRVIVPPIYRMIKIPVGMYCAVEKNYGQWGVISIDGTVLVEPKYTDVSIEGNGIAQLTYVTGKKVSVRL